MCGDIIEMLRMIIFTGLLLTSIKAFSGMSGVYEIRHVYVRETVTDIALVGSFNDWDACTKTTVFRILNGKHANTDVMISAALAAHLSGKKIRAYIGECSNDGYPIVYAIQVEK